LRYGYTRLRAAAFAASLSVFLTSTGAPAPVAASTGADSVIAVAKAQLGDPWVHGAIGPRAFDCSGLVYYAFRVTGNLNRIGGGRMSGYGYLAYFRQRGLASTGGGRPGDLVVWGGGSHVGIYLGNGMAISTLVRGVTVHGVYAVTARFTAFLHTGMSSGTAVPAMAPSPFPVPAAKPPAPAIPAPTTPAPASPVRRTIVNLHLRRGPGTGTRILTTLPTGTRFSVLGSGADRLGRLWYSVRTASGATGWVAGWYTRPYPH
jgi:NlpC/P60 family/Bacterial SH3 domain